MQKLRLLVVTLGHFCVDSYGTMLPPVLPLVIQRLQLDLVYAGLMLSMVSLASLTQPLMGLWGDRMPRRYLVIAGVILSGGFIPLLGVVPSYGTLILVLFLGGLGVHAFHPQSFSLVGELSGNRRSFGLALFIFGGTMALGLTPIWVPAFVTTFDLAYLPVVGVPGLLAVVLIYRFVPLDNPHLQHRKPSSVRQALGPHAGVLLLITLVVFLRCITSIIFGFFLTVLATERGMSLQAGGLALAVYSTSGVVGGLVVGYLADRMNPKPLVWGSILLAAPALYAFLQMEGPLAYVLLAVGGCMILSSNSVLVAVAQELAPENAALVSSLPAGLSWGLAGLTAPLFGHMADVIGLTQTLEYLALLPVFTAFLALFLPGRKHHHRDP